MRHIYLLLYKATKFHLIYKFYYKSYIKFLKRSGVSIGTETVIINCTFSQSHKGDHFIIGNGCTLTGVTFVAHDASPTLFIPELNVKKDVMALGSRRSYRAPIRIGDNVFIGIGTIILPGVTIGDNVVIGAGSVVTRNIPGNQVAAGNPAKVICPIDEYITKYRSLLDTIPERF